jgi:hypothetical protein
VVLPEAIAAQLMAELVALVLITALGLALLALFTMTDSLLGAGAGAVSFQPELVE